jgi:F-type H+-transporting ATPase subunit epsilon
MSMLCHIVTQDKSLFEGEVDILLAPGSEGELGILPNHTPLLTTLDLGVLRIRHDDGEEAFTITGGILEVRPDIVTVLADVGERVDEIDAARAEAAKKRAEELLEQGPPPDTDEYLRILAALRRSNLRLEAVNKYRRPGQRRTRTALQEGAE